MAAFYMLAGTLRTSLTLRQMQNRLLQKGIDCVFDRDADELLLQRFAANFALRASGFGHEMIAVGDAACEAELMVAVKQLSAALQALDIRYEFELYDLENHLIRQLSG